MAPSRNASATTSPNSGISVRHLAPAPRLIRSPSPSMLCRRCAWSQVIWPVSNPCGSRTLSGFAWTRAISAARPVASFSSRRRRRSFHLRSCAFQRFTSSDRGGRMSVCSRSPGSGPLQLPSTADGATQPVGHSAHTFGRCCQTNSHNSLIGKAMALVERA